MTQTKTEIAEKETERAKLNSIAVHWSEHGEFPPGITESDVQALGRSVYDRVEDRLERFVTKTSFNRAEAEVWVVRHIKDKQYRSLTDAAVALVVSATGTGFVGPDESDTDTVTSDDVQEWYGAAERKVDTAEEIVGEVYHPGRENDFNTPALVWLESDTCHRLKDVRTPTDNKFDDVITRLLKDVETRRSLDEFAREYLASRGKDNVAQLALSEELIEDGRLAVTAHTPINAELPDVVEATDVITLHGHRFEFVLEEDPYGPQDLGRITLYASDTIRGMDPVSLEDGIAAAEDHVRGLVERGELNHTHRIV